MIEDRRRERERACVYFTDRVHRATLLEAILHWRCVGCGFLWHGRPPSRHAYTAESFPPCMECGTGVVLFEGHSAPHKGQSDVGAGTPGNAPLRASESEQSALPYGAPPSRAWTESEDRRGGKI